MSKKNTIIAITAKKLNYDKKAAQLFPFNAPAHFCRNIDITNPRDPLLLQVLPSAAELIFATRYTKDPLAEKKFSPLPGLIHKYYGRALILVTDKCAINCRFCFRRFSRNKISNWLKVYNYLNNDKTIKEVILSGGDPLTLGATQLKKIINEISEIPHIQILRLHTRIPIVCPQRINNNLITAITATRLHIVIVTHCNHADEITTEVTTAIKAIRQAGISVLNQSVLLKGVNNSAESLITLSEKLFAAGILPYYLHLLDKVQGAQHFAVGKNDAKKIYRKMLEQLPGFLVPKLVYEKPGAPFKIPFSAWH